MCFLDIARAAATVLKGESLQATAAAAAAAAGAAAAGASGAAAAGKAGAGAGATGGNTMFGSGGMGDNEDESCPGGQPCPPTIDTIINNISHAGKYILLPTNTYMVKQLLTYFGGEGNVPTLVHNQS